MACLHYSHDLKDRAHDLLKVDFKKGSQLAIFKGIIDYLSSNKELITSVKGYEQKTISSTTKRNNAHDENHQSGAFRGNVSRCQIVQLKKDLVKVIKTTGKHRFMLRFCVKELNGIKIIMSFSNLISSHTQTTKA